MPSTSIVIVIKSSEVLRTLNQPTVTSDVIYPSVAAAASASVIDGTERVELAAQSRTSNRHPGLAAARRFRRATTSVWVKSSGLRRRDQHEIHDAEQRSTTTTTCVDRRLCLHGCHPLPTPQRLSPVVVNGLWI